uniref:Uncharacterized protein n=1 Tax=Erwinia amylovora ATCC BAA-2158 TaxID=889211 RepID=E5B5C5_ERWAM|nr:hypothetical protein predicted by Glimmer/Critica [Erwinia amylovora ATCC BAA-2158]
MPGTNSTRRLYNGTALASMLMPEVNNCGLKFSGEPYEQYTSVFASAPLAILNVSAASTICSRVFFISILSFIDI